MIDSRRLTGAHPLLLVCIALIAAFLLLSTAFQIRAVEGRSMEPNIPAGSRIIVLRLAYGLSLPFSQRKELLRWKEVDRNDIIVFIHPETGKEVVKRCAGVPGDYVAPMGGGVTLLPETDPGRLPEQAYPIPERFLYVVGDMKGASIDSRTYGLIPRASVRGRVLLTRFDRQTSE